MPNRKCVGRREAPYCNFRFLLTLIVNPFRSFFEEYSGLLRGTFGPSHRSLALKLTIAKYAGSRNFALCRILSHGLGRGKPGSD